MADTDDRDTPRIGRPADYPTATVPDDDHTPPPAPPPIPTPIARERVKAATVDPVLPPTARQAIAELDRQMSQLRAVATELAAAATSVHPVRKAPDQLAELATRIDRLERRPDAILDDLDELKERVIDIAGRSGSNGRLGTLAGRVTAVEADVAANTTTLEGVKKFMWTMLGMAAAGSLLGGLLAKYLLP